MGGANDPFGSRFSGELLQVTSKGVDILSSSLVQVEEASTGSAALPKNVCRHACVYTLKH